MPWDENEIGALEGAIQGVKKTLLPDDRKKGLKDFYNWHKKCKWNKIGS